MKQKQTFDLLKIDSIGRGVHTLLLTPIEDAAAATTPLFQMSCEAPKVYLLIENYSTDQSSPIKATEIFFEQSIEDASKSNKR